MKNVSDSDMAKASTFVRHTGATKIRSFHANAFATVACLVRYKADRGGGVTPPQRGRRNDGIPPKDAAYESASREAPSWIAA